MSRTESKTLTITPYKNGFVINHSQVKQGKIMEDLAQLVKEELLSLHGSPQLSIGDKRLEKEFTVTITFDFNNY